MPDYTEPWNGTVPRSRLLDALSLLLPAAETFVISTLTEWRKEDAHRIDPRMGEEIDRFIREEQAHQRAHERYNLGLIMASPGAATAAKRAAHAADDLASLSLTTRMALCAAFEQLTSVVSHELLERGFLLRDEASPHARLWRWHAREEIDHCHVALEAAALCGVGRIRRTLALVAGATLLSFDVLVGTARLCRIDIKAGANRWVVWRDSFSLVARSLPALARMARASLRCAAA